VRAILFTRLCRSLAMSRLIVFGFVLVNGP
jgi:hypothetical protein